MPNWATNTIEITGDATELQNLLNKASEGNGNTFLLNNLVPMPAHLEGTNSPSDEKEGEFSHAISGDKDYEYGSWYSWRLAHWGTKWDLGQDELPETLLVEKTTEGEGKVVFGYSTAWSPISEFWVAVSKQYPTLLFREQYYEEGCDFIGETLIKGGEVQDEICTNITLEHYKKAGANFTPEGEIDWEVSEIYLHEVFPLI
jgi:hypothetical protein